MNKFKELGIQEEILKTIQEQKFENPTEIQEKTIPHILKKSDVIAGSATGSGKTLAFGVGLIQGIKRGDGIQAIVVTPTRELAVQVAGAIKTLSKHTGHQTAVVYGGVGLSPQIDRIRKSDIVVGTPGRILDHVSRRTLNLSRIKVLVLDEADRMFDMGFIDDVKKIIRECPKNRQTLLFSATITERVSDLSKHYMNNPVKITAESYVDPSKLKQVYYDIEKKMKFSLLVFLLKKDKGVRAMLFTNSRRTADFLDKNLKLQGLHVETLHGGFSQYKRNSVLRDFHSGKVNILICTDVAARGLDISGVTHIYNYDMPDDSKQYIHRIGRTARAGKDGLAISLLSEEDHNNFSKVLHSHSLDIECAERPYLPLVKIQPLGRRIPMERRGNFHRARRR